MGKVKEQSVAYKLRKASPTRKLAGDIPWPPLTASQLRKLPPRQRSQILALQAKHAAGMIALGNDEVIDSSSIDIEY